MNICMKSHLYLPPTDLTQVYFINFILQWSFFSSYKNQQESESFHSEALRDSFVLYIYNLVIIPRKNIWLILLNFLSWSKSDKKTYNMKCGEELPWLLKITCTWKRQVPISHFGKRLGPLPVGKKLYNKRVEAVYIYHI